MPGRGCQASVLVVGWTMSGLSCRRSLPGRFVQLPAECQHFVSTHVY